MKLDEQLKLRLQFLSRVVKKEANYLQATDARLFAKALAVSDLQRIAEDPVGRSNSPISGQVKLPHLNGLSIKASRPSFSRSSAPGRTLSLPLD